MILSHQRRALESLRPDNEESHSFVLEKNNLQRFYLDGDEIFLLGVSEGIGTCSDLKGVYIAVFDLAKEDHLSCWHVSNHCVCSWGALLITQYSVVKGRRYPHQDVDRFFLDSRKEVLGLLVERVSRDRIDFTLSGKSAVYIQTIT